MLDFSVSVLPLVVVALANFVASWLWYSPMLFAKPWQRALGVPEGHQMTEEEKRRMPMLFGSGLVSSFILAYALQVLVHTVGATSFGSGLLVGLALWCGFVLTHSLDTLWEGRKPTVLVINNGLFILKYALLGGLVAVWR